MGMPLSRTTARYPADPWILTVQSPGQAFRRLHDPRRFQTTRSNATQSSGVSSQSKLLTALRSSSSKDVFHTEAAHHETLSFCIFKAMLHPLHHACPICQVFSNKSRLVTRQRASTSQSLHFHTVAFGLLPVDHLNTVSNLTQQQLWTGSLRIFTLKPQASSYGVSPSEQA